MKTIPLITASLALSLAACGGGSSGSNNNVSSTAISSTVNSSSLISVASSDSSESSQAPLSSSAPASEESSSITSSVNSSETTSSSASTESGMWNLYRGNYHPATNSSITLVDNTAAEFIQTGTGDFFTAQVDGMVVLDTSADAANTSGVSFANVVNADAVYPKYFTLVAGVSGNNDNLRVLELEVAMADTAAAGSRLKIILRNDGSNKGVQLERANNDVTVNSFGVVDMDKFAIYQVAITLTDATTGTVSVYRNGALMPNLSLTGVTMRATSAAGDNFIRVGEISGSAAYKSTIDWLVWTNEAAYSPDDISDWLPADMGCVFGYGSSDQTETCTNISSSSSSVATGGGSSSAASSIDFGSADIRPAKMEGYAAYANVTGGAGGETITVSTGTQLNAALCTARASKTTPIIIMVDGTINHANTSAQGCNTQADVIEIKQMSNVSIIGVGTNALFDEIGIHVRDASNIIIQNVHVRNVKKSGSPISNGGDAIGMETNVDRVWLDHNWLEASGGEKDGYDSLIDMKSGVTNVTVSYTLFNDSSRAGLVGFNDSDDANNNITFHHNWYHNIQQRTPLVRQALVHSYNNYWDNDDISYMIHGINSRANAKVLVESNYFHNTNNPLIASDDSPTAGCWTTNNDNTVTPYIYYSRSVGNGALVVPAIVDGQLQSSCTEAVTVPYTVELDPSANVPAVVMANAGVGIISTGSGNSSSSSSETSSAASSAVSSAASSSSVTTPGTSAGFSEMFDVDKDTLFSAQYQAISTDATASLFFITGGGSGISFAVDDNNTKKNELTIAGGRFSIGNRPPRTSTTATDTSANGDFDLSRPYRISFTVVTASGAGKVQVYIDNNGTSAGNSMHGSDSRVFDAAANSLTAGQLVEITPSVGTTTSFIAFRAESSATIVIDNLKLEYLSN